MAYPSYVAATFRLATGSPSLHRLHNTITHPDGANGMEWDYGTTITWLPLSLATEFVKHLFCSSTIANTRISISS